VREQRLVFGEDPDLYDVARPSYPDALLDDVAAMAGPAGRVLDIGCGTGKATVLLAARGLSGVGVEADPAMATVARRHLDGNPHWRIEVSDFEKWQPPDGAPFDLVCAAQAWHWLDPAVRMHRVHQLLRQGGWVALWWNRPADDTDIAEEIDAIYAEVAPQIAAKSGIGSKGRPPPAEEIPPDLSFGEPVRRSYPWAQDYTPDEWVALLRTQSDHRLLPSVQLDELTGRIRKFLIAKGGVYHHRYVCRLWAAQKSGPPQDDL
jgi:SAM-dependent methyltransferase